MLENLLATCGLNKTEQKVLMALVRRGSGIASIIAKQTGVKRPTVYAALDSLIRFGLVTSEKRSGVNYFDVIALRLIPKVLENHAKIQFNDVKGALKAMPQELSKFAIKEKFELAGFEIRTMESIEAVYAQLEDSLLGGDFCAIFNPQVAIKGQIKDIVINFLKETAKTRPRIREIAVAGSTTDWYKSYIRNPNHIVKELPSAQKFPTDMILLKGSVILSHYELRNALSIKITHQEFYQSMMTMFEMTWASI